jgi:hypothetical protein
VSALVLLLVLLLALQDAGSGAAAGQVLQSPVGGMMATLLAEAATSHMAAAQTPW